MKELITRLTSPSPTFFKRIQAIGITVGVIGGTLMALPTTIIILPAALSTAAGYMVAIGTVAAAVAKTPVADPTVLNKD